MLTYEAATKLVANAVAKATELGVVGSVAVIDDGGNLKAFARMDGSLLGSADGAERKARTSAVSGLSTAQWFEIYSGDATFGSIVSHGMDDVLFLPGGEPVVIDGKPVGGVGFSGGQPDQDVAVVSAALAAL